MLSSFKDLSEGGKMRGRGEEATVEYWDAALVLKWFARVWLVQMTLSYCLDLKYLYYICTMWGERKKTTKACAFVVFLVLGIVGYFPLFCSWRLCFEKEESLSKTHQLKNASWKSQNRSGTECFCLRFQLLISVYDDMWRRLANVCHCG